MKAIAIFRVRDCGGLNKDGSRGGEETLILWVYFEGRTDRICQGISCKMGKRERKKIAKSGYREEYTQLCCA